MKSRARLLVLSHIAQFSLQRRIGAMAYPGSADMSFHDAGAFRPVNVQPGDLVAVQSAPPTKWYLGWLISVQRPEGWADNQYTIESIEDGDLCDWTNVGLIYYDRSQVEKHPEWRWTDAQHTFNDRWFRVCREERDAYIYLPTQAVFFADNGVTLGTRTRYGLSDAHPSQSFPNWRKVTKKMMLEFYDAAVEIAKAPDASVA